MAGQFEAILFDCDGVLADTEKDGHRIAFNEAFSEFGIAAHWDEELYGELIKIGGGKNRMAHYFKNHPDTVGLPDDPSALPELIDKLHARKSAIFQGLADSGKLPARPGIARLLREILHREIPVAIASTSAVASVKRVLISVVGEELAQHIPVLGGEDAAKSKPDPEIYLVAMERLGVKDAHKVAVVEDSGIGAAAGLASGARVVVTPSYYTADHDFAGVKAIVTSLGSEAEKASMVAGTDIVNASGLVDVTSLEAVL